MRLGGWIVQLHSATAGIISALGSRENFAASLHGRVQECREVRARYLRGNPANGLIRDDMPRHHREEVTFLSAAQVERLAQAVEAVAEEAGN
ncbi:hypothetical protein CH304_16245 [Rhodococcus sp. 15-649-1-2]|nr:hypothetical protein CH304_16245 [Rhodococcus sp. 15-649-1-2]